jgi:asparagine synthase (glutamine-hydrolysing)
VRFTDFLINFDGSADATGASVKRFPESDTRKMGISGAGLTFSWTEKSEKLLDEYSGKNWRCWRFGEMESLGPVATSGTATLAQVADDLEAGTLEPSNLNGHFLLLAHHLPTGRWHIWTNRFGTFHSYYGTDGQRAAVGTFFPAVATVSSRRQLDWEALTGFFAFGFFPEDRTHFVDVKILQPASHYAFGSDGRLLHKERYWQWWHKADLRRSYDDTVAEFNHHLNEVLSSQIQDGRVAIPISGGLDSRSTVAVLTTSNGALQPDPRLWSYSYGYSTRSVETRIGRRVAAARGLPFQSFAIGSYLFDRLDLIIQSVEGFQDITQCRQASVVDEISSHADYLIAAHWGDVWLDDMGLANDQRSNDGEFVLSHVLHKLAKPECVWLLEHLCSPRLSGEEPESILRKMVQKEISQLDHIEDPDFRMKAFKTDQWSFRWTTASLRMFQAAAFPRLPFYDSRLSDFFCTVPSRLVSGRRLQIDFLKRFAPDLARITWQVYDTNLFRYQHSNSWLLPKRALKKGFRMLTNKRTIQRNWEAQFLSEDGRAGLRHWLLRDGLRLHEFVEPVAVRQLLDAFYSSPDKAAGYTLSMLLTFSSWLEHY